MAFVKHGAGKLKDKLSVKKDKKTGKKKVASTPLPEAPAAAPAPTPTVAPAPTPTLSTGEKADGESA